MEEEIKKINKIKNNNGIKNNNNNKAGKNIYDTSHKNNP